VRLFGRDWTRRELEARVGRIEQIGGLRFLRAAEAREAGVEEILPSRGMDIGLAEYGGVPLSWLSPNGEVHPSFFDGRGLGWLRTAAGGLLMTCGLSQVGSPGADGGEELGLHGRAHHTPARQVCAEGHWEGDEYMTIVQGKIEETSIFGWNLRLTRHISSWLGENEIIIRDAVENAGFEPAPQMILYHFNFGFPLLDPATEISFPAGSVTPREPDLPLEGLESWEAPQAGYHERVYYHENMSVAADGMAAVSLRNAHFPPAGRPLTVRLGWDALSLPVLVQWKMPGQGTHVLGIEPANCHVEGRAAERERGTLVMIAPGQTIEYHLKLTLSEE
jgi:hypothetical protein